MGLTAFHYATKKKATAVLRLLLEKTENKAAVIDVQDEASGPYSHTGSKSDATEFLARCPCGWEHLFRFPLAMSPEAGVPQSLCFA
eukprot:4483976-Pleurochrysis_carterae.AAC.3